MMRKAPLFVLTGFLMCQQMLLADSPGTPARHYTACTLMTLDDAKSLIGSDAQAQPDSSTENHCYYRSGNGAAYLHLSSADGHLWLDHRAAGTQQKGVGDEAYLYTDRDMGNTLMVRKGETAITINAWDNRLSDEEIQKKEVTYSRRMSARL